LWGGSENGTDDFLHVDSPDQHRSVVDGYRVRRHRDLLVLERVSMILPYQVIKMLQPVKPFVERTIHPESGMTYGVGPAGYDVRVAEDFYLRPGDFRLASTVEHFEIPPDIMAFVTDKSTLARAGVSAFNTVIEPGWHGFLTLELKNHGHNIVHIVAGMPIAQIIFHVLDGMTEFPYDGKYQGQPARPVNPIFEA